MDKVWLRWVLGVSFVLLSLLKVRESTTLIPYFRAEPTIKLDRFASARLTVKGEDVDLLKLWESMLTGRSAPLAKWIRERYRVLGLTHVFTPSGFHLSAVLSPLLLIVRKNWLHWAILLWLWAFLCFLPGLAALKRMALVKISQKAFGQKAGFILALGFDVLFGTFQGSPGSFSYSLLFLGIIYSGSSGIGLILWFFIAQLLIGYFQELQVSPLLIILSPLLNAGLGLLMPLLLVCSYPLWPWQMELGLGALRRMQTAVDLSAGALSHFPSLEVHSGLLLLGVLLLGRNFRASVALVLFLSSSLNPETAKPPGPGVNEYVPRGKLVGVSLRPDHDLVRFKDGSCHRKLVRGMWWETCSPKRESRRGKLL